MAQVSVGDLVAKLRADISEWERNFGKADQSARRLGGTVQETARKASLGFGAMIKGAVGFAGVMAGARGVEGVVRAATSSIVGLNATLESSELQFKKLLGSADAAKAHVGSLFKFAAQTPFETQPIIEASRLLLAFGIQAKDSENALRLVGDAAAISGRAINEVAFWYGRAVSMIQAGKPFGEAAMRLQEMTVLSAEGRNKLEALQEAGGSVAEMMVELNKEFARSAGAMKDLAGTWVGLTSTIKDSVQLAISQGFKPFYDALKLVAEGIAKAVQTEEFAAKMKELGDIMFAQFERMTLTAAQVADVLRPIISSIFDTIGSAWDLFQRLPSWVQTVGIVGAFMLGVKGTFLLAGAIGVIEKILKTIEAHNKGMPFSRIVFSNDEEVQAWVDTFNELEGEKKGGLKPAKSKYAPGSYAGGVAGFFDRLRLRQQLALEEADTLADGGATAVAAAAKAAAAGGAGKDFYTVSTQGGRSLSDTLRGRAAREEYFQEISAGTRESLSATEAAIADLSQRLSTAEDAFLGFADATEQVDPDLLRLVETTAKVDAVMKDFTDATAAAAAEAKLLGLSSRETAGREIANLENALRALAADPLTRASEKTKELSDRLKELKAHRDLENTFRGVFQSITSAMEKAVTGVIQGTVKMKDAFRNLAQSIILELGQRVVREAINPLIDGMASVAATLWRQAWAPAVTSGAALATGGSAAPAGTGSSWFSSLFQTGISTAYSGLTGSSQILAPGVTNLFGSAGLAQMFPGVANMGYNWATGGTSGVLFGMAPTVALAPGAAAQGTIELAALGGASIGGTSSTAGATSGLAGSSGMLSAAAPYLAAAGIALNLGTAIFGGDPTSNASIGTYAGTAAGAIGGAIIGSIFPVIGTTIGALLGAALGGSAGGFLGGLFGEGKSHEQREAEELKRTLGRVGEFQGALSGAQSMLEFYNTLTQWGSGYTGGTSTQAIMTGFSNIPAAFQQYITPGAVGPGGYASTSGAFVGSPNPYYNTISQEGFRALAAAGKLGEAGFFTSTQAGINQGMLAGPNAQMTEQIQAMAEMLIEYEAEQVENARNALEALRKTVEDFQEQIGEIAGITSTASTNFEAFGARLDEMVTSFAGAIERGRAKITGAESIADAIQYTDELRTTIAKRYQEELKYINDIIGEWVGAKAIVDSTLNALRMSEMSSTNPSQIYNARRTQFDELIDKFFASPSPELAEAIVAGAQGVLEAGQMMWDRPSIQFQSLFTEITSALEAVSGSLGGEIGKFTGGMDYEEFMAEKQQEVVDQLALLHDDLQSVIDQLDPSMSLEAALETFKTLSAAAEEQFGGSGLEEVQTGLLGQIAENTGRMVSALGAAPAAPYTTSTQWPGYNESAQIGMDYVPRRMGVLVHPREAILDADAADAWRAGRSGGVALHVGSIHVTGGGDPQRTADAVVDALVQKLRQPTRLRAAVQSAAKGV